MSNIKNTVFFFLLVLFSLIVITGCSPAEDADELEFQVPVAVEEIGTATMEKKIVTTGTLRAPVIETLTARVPGILEINSFTDEKGKPIRRLAEGDSVKAGQEIARLVGEDLRLEVRMDSARQGFLNAQNEYERTKRMFAQKYLTQSDLDKAELALEQTRLEYERSQHTQERGHLVSSIDGVIIKLARDANGELMTNGQLVNVSQEIAQIAPLDSLIADIDLVGKDGLADVKVGQEARIVHLAWDDMEFTGKVLRIAPTVDKKTRALRAEVVFDNQSGLLRPGMFVEVTLISERRENVAVVPRLAVTERGGRRVVFILRGQRVTQVPVELGLGDDYFVEIRSGVEVGERVVVRGLETLTDQMPVRVSGT